MHGVKFNGMKSQHNIEGKADTVYSVKKVKIPQSSTGAKTMKTFTLCFKRTTKLTRFNQPISNLSNQVFLAKLQYASLKLIKIGTSLNQNRLIHVTVSPFQIILKEASPIFSTFSPTFGDFGITRKRIFFS